MTRIFIFFLGAEDERAELEDQMDHDIDGSNLDAELDGTLSLFDS